MWRYLLMKMVIPAETISEGEEGTEDTDDTNSVEPESTGDIGRTAPCILTPEYDVIIHSYVVTCSYSFLLKS